VNDPVYTTWPTQNIDAKVRATVISMSDQVDAFGQIVGGPPVGYIGTAFSIRAALLASGERSAQVLLYAYATRKNRGKLTQASYWLARFMPACYTRKYFLRRNSEIKGA